MGGYRVLTRHDVQVSTGINLGIAPHIGVGTGQGDVLASLGIQVAAYGQPRLHLINSGGGGRLKALIAVLADHPCRGGGVFVLDGVKHNVVARFERCVAARPHLRADVGDVFGRIQRQATRRLDPGNFTHRGANVAARTRALRQSLIFDAAFGRLHADVAALDTARKIGDIPLGRNR